MKTSTFLIALLALNSGVLAGQISNLIGGISPLIIGASELVLVGGYFAHSIIKDVRRPFDVDIKM